MKCDRVRKAFDSHLSRAKWMTESTVIVTCYYVVVRRLKATLQFVPSARRKSKPRRPRLACRLFDSKAIHNTNPSPDRSVLQWLSWHWGAQRYRPSGHQYVGVP